jgi:hypothetical protein
MSELDLDAVTKEIERLLESVPPNKYSLEERRYALRNVVYKGAMKILEDFPDIIVGQEPRSRHASKKRGGPVRGEPDAIGIPVYPVAEGQRPPYFPSGIHWLLCLSLGTCPQQT